MTGMETRSLKNNIRSMANEQMLNPQPEYIHQTRAFGRELTNYPQGTQHPALSVNSKPF